MAKSPDAFRTISEVADELDVPQHVLRFWETKFTQIKPLKRAGGRRYYRPADVGLIRGIQSLLYSDGYTIKGVQRILKDQGVRYVANNGKGTSEADAVALSSREIDLEAGKADLPVPPVAAPTATQANPAPKTAAETDAGISPGQRDVMARVLSDLVALKARVTDVRQGTREEDDMPLLAKMRAPE